MLLSHADRTRVIADEHRTIISVNRLTRGSVLVDGFMCGTWRSERTRDTATLIIEPFVLLSAAERAVVAAEGEQLVRFIEDGATVFVVRFTAGS